MKNIFKDAKFGDIFIDADGKEMKFVMSDENRARLLEDDKDTGRQWLWEYNLDGTTDCGVEVLHKTTSKPITEEYLLDNGFTKDFSDLLNEEYFVGPNNQVTVWRNYDNVPSPYDWHAIINNDDNTRDSMDIAYVDEFESFLKLCRIKGYE